MSKADNYNQFTKEEIDISSLAERPAMVPVCGNQSRIIYEVVDISVDGEDRRGELYSYDPESKQFDALSLEGNESVDVALYGCMNEAGEIFLIRENVFYIYQADGRLDSVVLFSELGDLNGDMLEIKSAAVVSAFVYFRVVRQAGFQVLIHFFLY